jgi:diguanylate cyclase (GGDEF)-like protein
MAVTEPGDTTAMATASGSDRSDLTPAAGAPPAEATTRDTAFLRGVLRASPTVSVLVDATGTVEWVSDNVEELFEFTPDELVGTNMVEHMDLEWSSFALDSVGFAMENAGQHLPMLFRFLTKSGDGMICEVTANNQFDNPAVGGLVVQVRHWEERVILDRVLDSLATAAPLEETLTLIVTAASAEMLESDGAILYGTGPEGFSQRVTTPGLDPLLAGDPHAAAYEVHDAAPWGRAVASGVPCFVAVEDLPPLVALRAVEAGYQACWVWPVGVSGGIGVQACAVLWRRQLGDPEPSCEFAAHRLVHLAALALERERNHRRLVHAALHDSLTGLANRAHFFAGVDESLAQDAGLVGVLYIDLDGFKPVNDVYGHGVGDQVLVEVSRRLQGVVRPSDVVARLGGDEFAVLCPGIKGDGEVRAIAERLVKLVGRSIDVDGTLLRVGASVGVAVAPAGTCTSDALVEAADAALYDVKSGSKGGWRLAPPLDRTG